MFVNQIQTQVLETQIIARKLYLFNLCPILPFFRKLGTQAEHAQLSLD